jgi:hypothetical protein
LYVFILIVNNKIKNHLNAKNNKLSKWAASRRRPHNSANKNGEASDHEQVPDIYSLQKLV